MSTVSTPFSTPAPVPIVLPDVGDDFLYEVIDGQVVEIPHMGAFQSLLASELSHLIRTYLDTNPLGLVGVEVLFTLDREGRLRRRPDIAYVAYDRWPEATVPDVEAWEIAPDLAVEVVSPTNSAREIDGKIVDYFRSGVRLVWVVYPESGRIHVYNSAVNSNVVERDGELTGGDVLPGFQVKVADLYRGFTKPTAPPSP
jgi:Uma2 family endonuclease